MKFFKKKTLKRRQCDVGVCFPEKTSHNEYDDFEHKMKMRRIVPLRTAPTCPAVKAPFNFNEPHGIAEYDFNSGIPGDLVFKVGDTIVILSDEEQDFYKGRCIRTWRVGLVPKQFIKIKVPKLQKSLSIHPSITADIVLYKPIAPSLKTIADSIELSPQITQNS